MKSRISTFLSLVACLTWFFAAPLAAQTDTGFIELGDDPPRELANISAGVPRGQELPENDPRIRQAREWLRQAATATGQEEEWIAANALKLSRYIFTTQGVRATPLEVLEAYARLAAPGKPLSDVSNAYFQARRQAPDHSHAAAMKALIR
ncbi:MAG: hypothetical protein HXY29_09700 [Rhodocyclaceae bacterium]|jgi:hypothetical protein|nr:hypothetical protein [Rhodocyclaceae bacterium]